MSKSCLLTLKNTLDLKQAPKAWYKRLTTFILKNNFQREKIDSTLFIQKIDASILIVQSYVDDIIFGSPNSLYARILQILWKENLR